jgi:hypothetical protein
VKLSRKAFAILLVIIIAVTVGTVVSYQLTKKSMIIVGPSLAVVEPASPSNLDNSSIFLISATSAYGTYPFVSAVSPKPGSTPIILKGDPCFIINATIKNDYTLENLPPNQAGTKYYANGTTTNTPSTGVYVFLTASIYDKQGRIIQATDVTPPYGYPSGGAFVYLQSGESATLTIYLAISQQDINHFDIILRYVGTIPLP